MIRRRLLGIRTALQTRKPPPFLNLPLPSHSINMLIERVNGTLRTYTLYITYTPYYRTPRLYLSGYGPSSQPLPPAQMMDDIVGDYKDKTVTLEDFPFFPAGVKCASVHPCRHASVMKVLLDRAEGALKRRREKITNGTVKAGEAQGLEGLVDSTKNLSVKDSKKKVDKEDEWEVVSDNDEKESDEVAIRVDQYLVVFLKVSSCLLVCMLFGVWLFGEMLIVWVVHIERYADD